jgi:phage terminase small subunit
MSLNAKQDRFAREYVVDYNATQAAIRAGYSDQSAYSQGQRLLKHAEVSRFVETLKAETDQKLELSREFVISGLMNIAANGRIESAKVRAFELLGKHLALFNDRLEISQVPSSDLVRQWIDALEADVATSDY